MDNVIDYVKGEMVAPSYESEAQECDRIFENILYTIRRQKNYAVNTDLLKRAYARAKQLHGDTRRLTKELYLRHPLAVMKTLSSLMCKNSILAAALLHDTLEDCANVYSYDDLRAEFTFEVAEIVQAVTRIKAKEQEHEIPDEITDESLLRSPYQREAILVRMADRAHNLATLAACDKVKQIEKVHSTRDYLIPIAKKLGIRYFEVVLSNYCLKYDGYGNHIPLCEQILNRRNWLVHSGTASMGSFDEILEEAIKSQDVFSFPPYNPYARLKRMASRKENSKENDITMLPANRRLLTEYEIIEQLKANKKFQSKRLFDRSQVELSEVILVCNEKSKKEMLASFIRFHKQHLQQHTIFFEYIKYGDVSVILKLTDKHENNYRIVLVREPDLAYYYIGDEDARLTLNATGTLQDTLSEKITIRTSYRRYNPTTGKLFTDGKTRTDVPVGSSALDFAFLCSTDMALTVTGVKIHHHNSGEDFDPQAEDFSQENEYNYPLKTILHDGDVVHFETDRDPEDKTKRKDHACLEWFAYLNTALAKQRLIEYLKTKE